MHNPLKRFVGFIQSPSHSRTLTALVILIIAAAIPLTVLVAQKQQEVRQRASTCTPGFQTCGGSLLRGYQQCNSSGTGYNQYQCPIGYHCGGTPGKTGDVSCYIDAAAAPTQTPTTNTKPTPTPTVPPGGVCSPNTQKCTGTTSFQQCNSTGTGWVSYDCKTQSGAGAGFYCQNYPGNGNVSCIRGCAERQASGEKIACQTSCGEGQTQIPTYYCSTGVCCTTSSPSPITCSSLTANPSSVTVGNSSSLTANCANTSSTTTYNWSSTCGLVASANTSGNTNTWTAPNNSATCTVSVNACNGSTCSTASTNINVASNLCNAGPLINCGVCQPALAVCGAGNGIQSCQYSTYNGSTNCTPSGTVANVCDLPVCSTPTPTASPARGDTLLAFTVGIDAIGSTGDNENPDSSSSNKNPLTPTRNLIVQVLDSNNNQVVNQLGSINYNSTSGVFSGTVDLGQNFTSGNYTVKVKSDGHLRRLVPGIQNITKGQTVQMPRINLVAGDVDNNNILNINDYNILLSCVSDPDITNIDNQALCNTNANYKKLSDLDDNGTIDKFDYNLFLREYAVQNGD